MTTTPQQLADFVSYARRPETWLFAARRQLAVSKILFEYQAAWIPSEVKSVEERSGCVAAAYFHAGLALENVIKAHLVVRDPAIIRNDGSIDRRKLGVKSGHGLVALCELVLPELQPREYRLLMKLEEHVLWLGKYTVPMHAAPLYDDALMDIVRNSSPDESNLIESLFARLVGNLPSDSK